MSPVLSASAKELLDRPIVAAFTTLDEDGSPHTTPVWVDRDGEVVRVNTAEGRVKARNVARDPRVALCLFDPDDPEVALALRGTVVEATTEGADAHADGLARTYTGADFEGGVPGQVRLLLRIRVDDVLMG